MSLRHPYGWKEERPPFWKMRVPVYVVAALLSIFTFFPMYAQLQQSGGAPASVSISSALPAGSNTIGGVNVVDSAGTNKLAVNASGQVTISNASFGVTGALPAGTNVLGTVNTIPKTACGNTVASQALAAVPTAATAVFSATTCVQVIVLNNTNATAATVTVTDNQATPINDVLTFSIPGNSQLIQPLGGVAFTTGVKWNASATGVTGAMLGYQ